MMNKKDLEGRMDWADEQLISLNKSKETQREINEHTGMALMAASEAFEAISEELTFLRSALTVMCMIVGGLTAGMILSKRDIRKLTNAMNEG